MKIRMKDIAEVCGVSVMTVSNAFNRPDQLSVELRERILARAEKMGYAGPDARARDLRSGRSNSYGVVFTSKLSYAFTDPYYTGWLAGFSEVMEERGASVILLSVPVGSPDAQDAVQRAAIDGLAGLCASNAVIRAARVRGLPVVLSTSSDDIDYVAIDDHAAGRDMARHVRRLGHHDIAVVIDTVDESPDLPAEYDTEAIKPVLDEMLAQGFRYRYHRWLGLLEEFGDTSLRVVVAGTNSRTAGSAAGALLLDRADRPTAIVALTDILALGVLDALAVRGLVAGRDVSVSGFDDLPGITEPAGLTTVAQPIEENGRLVARLLLDPERQPRHITLPHEVVSRRSTGPAPH